MKRLIKVSMIALAVSSIVGCASNSDVENLQTQVDGLKTSVAQASSDAAAANAAATDAKAAADRAAQTSQDTSNKLDSMFHRSMRK